MTPDVMFLYSNRAEGGSDNTHTYAFQDWPVEALDAGHLHPLRVIPLRIIPFGLVAEDRRKDGAAGVVGSPEAESAGEAR